MEKNEETKTTEPTAKPDPDTADKPLSIVEEARAIRDEIVKARDGLKEENDRKAKLQADEMLGSSAGGHIESTPKEESAKEYADRVMGNKPVASDGN